MVRARLRSSWIELLAIPMLASIMDVQPVFVVLVFISPIFTGDAASTAFISELSLILLALGLRWWAIAVHAATRHGLSQQNEQLLRILGLLLAGGLVLGTPVLLMRFPLSVILSSALIIWLWQRGIRQSIRLEDEPLLIYFRVGFVILILVLTFAVFYLDSSYVTLFATLAQALPVFFLSGVLCLSFTRIALIRQETARYTPDNPAGSTRNWLVMLTVFWFAVVLTVLALEAFSFQTVVVAVKAIGSLFFSVLQWLVTLLAYILTPILYVFSTLFGSFLGFFHIGSPIILPTLPPRGNTTGQQQQLSPEALAIGRFILLLLVLIALFFIVRAILRRLSKARKEDEVEEIREGLSLRSIVQQRRTTVQGQATLQAPQLETLEPDSARAYYRELLQTIATNNPAFARRPEETPAEYQARLLSLVQQTLSEQMQGQAMPSEQEILDVLTHDYTVERYGGKSLEQSQKDYLRSWVPELIGRLTHR